MTDETTPPQRPDQTPVPEPENRLAGYPQFLLESFTRTDEVLEDRYRGGQLFGLINLAILVVLLMLAPFIQRVMLSSTSGMRMSWLLNGIKSGLAYAIPLAIVVFLLQWYAGKQGKQRGLDFYLEKFGAMLALPIVLAAIGILLNLLTINIHTWFRGAGLTFMYLAVFMMSYLYAAPGRIRVAVVFTLGFYLACRLLHMLL